MAHLVMKYPTSKKESAFVESRFYFSRKHLDLVRSAKDDWGIWYLPKRANVSLFGAYIAIAFVGDIFPDPESHKHYVTLSMFETLVPPLRAVSIEAIYERDLAEPGHKSREQQGARPLPDQEFVNILEDHIINTDGQAHFSIAHQSAVDRARKMALFSDLVQATRERIRRTFPLTN
jgi:hypothetical protein